MKHARIGAGLLLFGSSLIGQGLSSAPALLLALPQASSPLVEELKSSDPKLRAKAAREIGKKADLSALPALAQTVRDPSSSVRREVVIALTQFHEATALGALITAAKDSDSDARVLAVKGLVGYYTGQTLIPGFAGFVRKQVGRARNLFVADNTRIDPGVHVDSKVVSALVETMKDAGSIQAAREAAKGLGILVAGTALPDLVKAAHSTDEDLARHALAALSKINDRAAGPQLVDLLDASSKDVKRDAAVTVGVLKAREALPKLQAIYENDSDHTNKEKALEGLAHLGDPVSVPLFTKALWSENKALRTSAAEGLARAGDSKSLSELMKALTVEKDAAVALAVQFALTALGRDDHFAALVDALATQARAEAAQAYLIELARNKKFLTKLYPYTNDPDPTVRRRLCTVLMVAGDATSLEPLDHLSHDPKGEVATAALRALRAVRARATPPPPA